MKKYLLLIIILLLCSCGKKNLNNYSIEDNNYEVILYYDKDVDYEFNELEDNKYSFESEELNIKGSLWLYEGDNYYKNKENRSSKKSFEEYKFNKKYDGYKFQLTNKDMEINILIGDEVLYFYIEELDRSKSIDMDEIIKDKVFNKMLNSIEIKKL